MITLELRNVSPSDFTQYKEHITPAMFYPKEVWTDHHVTTPIHVAACAQMVVTQAGSHVVARQHTQTPFRL